MTIEKAYQILKQHAEWRKGFGDEMVKPEELTKAYEVILAFIDNKLNNKRYATI
jgi:hypothetical protein